MPEPSESTFTRARANRRRAMIFRMIATSQPLATQAGLSMLQSGGNAVDAAVAVGFALEVTYPFAGNIGGGGFMLIHLASGKSVLVDYREEAPGAATSTMYQNSQGELIPHASTVGARAVGVPGTVAGLALAVAPEAMERGP